MSCRLVVGDVSKMRDAVYGVREAEESDTRRDEATGERRETDGEGDVQSKLLSRFHFARHAIIHGSMRN